MKTLIPPLPAHLRRRSKKKRKLDPIPVVFYKMKGRPMTDEIRMLGWLINICGISAENGGRRFGVTRLDMDSVEGIFFEKKGSGLVATATFK